ncbi:MAG: response regulator [Herpetosiphonaceae bacterium]|nr:response regulator [Herpetosiphonaceae bacterium]
MPIILVIDDEPTLRRLLGKVLQTAGYRTLLAETGTEGLHLLTRTPIDALICDLELPDITGVEVCRAVAALPQYANLPIILISGGSVAPHPSECRYTQFMRKPFQPSSLVARLKQLVPDDSG